MPDEECFSHKNMRFPQAGGLRDHGSVAILRKSQQGAATNNGSGLQNERWLCYSREVENKAVGLPVACEATPSTKDAKSLRPSSEARFVGWMRRKLPLTPEGNSSENNPPQDPGDDLSRASVARATAGRSLIFCAALTL
jgi:hypothetical protein